MEPKFTSEIAQEIRKYVEAKEKSRPFEIPDYEEARAICAFELNELEWLRSLLEENERLENELHNMGDSRNTLEHELEQVKKEREGVMNYLSNTEMTASGEPAMIFIEMLVGLFEQNGGKNFLTLTVERKDKSEKYSVTIQNLNGDLSPAEKMQILQNEAESLRSELAATRYEISEIGKEATAGLNGDLERADAALQRINLLSKNILATINESNPEPDTAPGYA